MQKYTFIGGIAVALVVLLGLALRPTEESTAEPSAPSPSQETRELGSLQTLGYLAGYRVPKSVAGAKVHDAAAIMPGYTLFSSGHGPTALLINREGEVVHSWFAPIEKAFPAYDVRKRKPGDQPYYWRFVRLLPNGDLLAIFEGIGIVRLDKDSNVLWSLENGAHHWIEDLGNETFALLTRKRVQVGKRSYLDDAVTIITAGGAELERISLPDAIKGSPFQQLIFGKKAKSWSGDILHTNSVRALPPHTSLPPGAAVGDLLLSMRSTNTLAILSRSTKKVVWAHRGAYRRQHSALIAADGSLLLFDNVGRGKRGPSRVLRYTFPDMRRLQAIEKLGGKDTFFTKLLGQVEELPNKNLLIVESEGGRIIELQPNGKLAWEYVSPYRATNNDAFVAVLAHAERIPVQQVESWR